MTHSKRIKDRSRDKDTGSKTKYTLYIPSDLTQIVITPTPKSENAKANKINLTLGTKQEPEITVSCTCADDKKEYTIQIKRIDKTTSEIEKEISQNGYAVYVTNQKFYQKTDFPAASVINSYIDSSKTSAAEMADYLSEPLPGYHIHEARLPWTLPRCSHLYLQ